LQYFIVFSCALSSLFSRGIWDGVRCSVIKDLVAQWLLVCAWRLPFSGLYSWTPTSSWEADSWTFFQGTYFVNGQLLLCRIIMLSTDHTEQLLFFTEA
jgi:hypothetical protein